MKKFMVRLFVMFIIMSNIMSVMIFADDSKTPPPAMPYEKVVAKIGDWYSEEISGNGGGMLFVGYLGKHSKNSNIKEMKFETKEEIIIKGIYLPYVRVSKEPVVIQLKDNRGNVYKDLLTEKFITNAIKDKPKDVIETAEEINYIFNSENDIVLPPGKYSMNISNFDDAVGDFLVKGINYSAYEKYKRDLKKWESENNKELSGNDKKDKTLGNEEFSKQNLEKYKYEKIDNLQTKNSMKFLLDSQYMIDEIIINTYNNGKGAIPGIITILSENGDIILSQQSYGCSLGDIANGMWKIAPKTVLPAGNYFVTISEPDMITYDENGEPLFYVKASIPVSIRYDFTGTYNINLDAYKTKTLMGVVSEQNSSFSLNDFELTVIDKDGEIELIGKYDGIPFSQGCKIVEETENSIAAKFELSADLTKLPYKAKIGANAVINLIKPENNEATINIEGTGTFKREASAKKGADDNEYSIVSNGTMSHKELPPFVMTALGKAGSAGNIPGPDNPQQAAAGILFPPLVGLIVATLQELLKPKEKAKASIRDKGWYKTNNPNLSDEQIAMVMLADAMGSTDNPDEGDAVSIGDNESYGDSDPQDESYGDESDIETQETEDSNDYSESNEYEEPKVNQPDTNSDIESKNLQEKVVSEEVKEEKPEVKTIDKISEEPEEMVLQTSANGATSRYVKNPETGEWVNAETGGVLDYEKYKQNSGKQFEEDKKFNDEQFDKMSKGETEHDKILREEMQKIKENEKLEAYKNTMKSKYGTDNIEDINTIIKAKAVLEKESFKRWQTIGDINAVGEVGATVVGAVADTAIDGLSEVTPGGNYIKAGYKVTKGIASTMADKGVSKASLYEGTIKGGTDAVLDAEYFKNNPLKKAVATVAGEAIGSAVGDAYRPDGNWQKAGTEGLIDGVFKVAVGNITDKVAGDANIVLPKGTPKFLPTMKNVLVNKSSASKVGGTLTDEFLVKPKAVNPIKKIM